MKRWIAWESRFCPLLKGWIHNPSVDWSLARCWSNQNLTEWILLLPIIKSRLQPPPLEHALCHLPWAQWPLVSSSPACELVGCLEASLPLLHSWKLAGGCKLKIGHEPVQLTCYLSFILDICKLSRIFFSIFLSLYLPQRIFIRRDGPSLYYFSFEVNWLALRLMVNPCHRLHTFLRLKCNGAYMVCI